MNFFKWYDLDRRLNILFFLLCAISNEKQRHFTHIIVISPTCSIFCCIWNKIIIMIHKGNLIILFALFTGRNKGERPLLCRQLNVNIGQQWKTNEWVIHFSAKEKNEKKHNCEMWARGLACGECFHSFSFIIQGPEWPITIRFARSWYVAFLFFALFTTKMIYTSSYLYKIIRCSIQFTWKEKKLTMKCCLKCLARKIVNEMSISIPNSV